MLQRVQLLIDSETRRKLKKVAIAEDRSMSGVAREILKNGMKKKKTKIKDNGAGFLLRWAKNAVKGPGDSEYDKYAYDDKWNK